MHPTRAGTLLRVLICCIAEDEAAARELARRLRIERMEPQLSIDGPLGAALARADVALVCLTPRALAGDMLAPALFTALELARRDASGRRLMLGLKLVACELPASLNELALVELHAPRGYERLMRTLWAHLVALRNSPRTGAAAPPLVVREAGLEAGASSLIGTQLSGLSTPAAALSRPSPSTAPAVSLPRFTTRHPELERRRAVRLGRGLAKTAWIMAPNAVLAVAAGGAVLLDPASGAALWEIDCPVTCAALSPDRRSLALGNGPRVLVWELETGKLRATYACPGARVTCLAFHPLNGLLAAGSTAGTVLLWREEGRSSAPVQTIASVPAHAERVNAVAFAPDGTLMATAAADRTARLWRTLDRSLVRTLTEQGAVEALAFAPDGATLALGHRARALAHWETATGQRLSILDGHGGPVEALAFAPDGSLLASGCADGLVRIWQGSAGAPLHALQGPGGPIADVHFAPASPQLVAVAGAGLLVLDSQSGARLAQSQPFSAPISALALSAGLVTLGHGDGVLRTYTLEGQAALSVQDQPPSPVVGLGVFQDQLLVAVHANGQVRNTSIDGVSAAALHNNEGAQQVVVEAGVSLRHGALCGTDLALAAGEAGMLLWQLAGTSWRRWASVATRPQRTRRVALAADGRLLAAIFEDGGLQTWHLPRTRQGTPDPFRAWPEAGRARDLSFTPDSLALAVVCEDGAIRIWRVADGAQSAIFEHEGEPATCLAITPDGGVLAAGFGDGTVRLWRLAAAKGGNKKGRNAPILLSGHASALERLAFSPDGAALVTVGADAVARVWPL